MRLFHLRFVSIRLVEDYLDTNQRIEDLFLGLSDGPLLSLRFRWTVFFSHYMFRRTVPSQFHSAARATVPGGPSVPCSTAKAVEWDAAWSQNLDLSGRAALGVHVAAYEEDKAEGARPKKLQAEKTAEGIV
ncbi:hypothetical protein HID58_077827 [Brassica napus]|uniref:Asparagine synthetase domain-containing protein n=1 Tax=Brassica napus TaxID=3708 RepID=A0ABQ7YRF9_BRANA|nr:hypothetical protein HID58_077827 [Brassica napus]